MEALDYCLKNKLISKEVMNYRMKTDPKKIIIRAVAMMEIREDYLRRQQEEQQQQEPPTQEP